MARPRKEINQKLFENLCAIQCTKEEVCTVLDVTDKTLESWCKRTYKEGFSEIFAKKRENGKASLRRTQFELAKKNATMAIFLGKQYLGQKDDYALQVSHEDDSSRALNEYIKQRTAGTSGHSD